MRDPRFQILDELLERDEWSLGQIKAHQAKRLERLLHVGWEHNPYWRDKFKRFGVNPNRTDPYVELAKLPILTKDEVRANFGQMHSTHLAKTNSIRVTSSGSTSLQVTVWQSQYYCHLHKAMDYRALAWMGVCPGDPYLTVHGHSPFTSKKKLLSSYLRTILDNGFTIDSSHIDPEPTKRLLRRAQQYGCVHVRGYTTAMAEVAELSQEMGLKWPTVKAVSTTAEPLPNETRKLLEDAYEAKVYDRYGSSEVLSISAECRMGKHHIFSDLNYVEFVQLEDADEGYEAILLTPLDNEAMPLFRYRNGDSASAVEGTCSCGSTLPLMTECKGRICGNLITPDGRIINGISFLWFFANQAGFRAYQFHQTSPEHIDLYVVPDGTLTEERRKYLDSACERIACDFHAGFKVDLHIVDEIPRTPTGKHMYIFSDCLKHL